MFLSFRAFIAIPIVSLALTGCVRIVSVEVRQMSAATCEVFQQHLAVGELRRASPSLVCTTSHQGRQVVCINQSSNVETLDSYLARMSALTEAQVAQACQDAIDNLPRDGGGDEDESYSPPG